MTFAIAAIVLLVVIVLFVLMSRKREEPSQAPAQKKPPAAESKAKSIKPGPQAKPESAPPAAESAPTAPEAPEPSAAKARSVPPARDLAELRKGLAKARGQTGFLGRLANLFAGKKELDPAIADQVEEILLTSDVGVTTTQTILTRLRDGLQKHELSSSQAVWDSLRAEALRILGI